MTETDEVDVTCPNCNHGFTVEVEAAETAPPTPNPSERYYKLSEVAERLSIGRSTLKKWIYEKKIKAVKFGKGGGSDPWRIADSEIARFTTAGN